MFYIYIYIFLGVNMNCQDYVEINIYFYFFYLKNYEFSSIRNMIYKISLNKIDREKKTRL